MYLNKFASWSVAVIMTAAQSITINVVFIPNFLKTKNSNNTYKGIEDHFSVMIRQDSSQEGFPKLFRYRNNCSS